MDEQEISVINVIPFIDIMLVLLTIVLTTSTFIAQGTIPLRLPQAGRQGQAALQGHMIEIAQDGRLFWDGTATSPAVLQEVLAAIDRNCPVLIRADRALALQGFVEVLEVVTRMGFKKISLQTEAMHGAAG